MLSACNMMGITYSCAIWFDIIRLWIIDDKYYYSCVRCMHKHNALLCAMNDSFDIVVHTHNEIYFLQEIQHGKRNSVLTKYKIREGLSGI